MKFLDKHVDETIYVGLIAAVALGLAVWLMGTASKKEQIILDEIVITPQVYEPLPEIVINDPILPRALPPLVEGGEVYFEEMYYHKYPEDL